ncbi:RNA-binding S4 domain-containing protein [Thioflexithrix psekupsensis]|uniref:RNA-binding S4 domain-containing protein n=1 Tax=Thioflexithrix psekupsensis TaxID=1570016 RepID=UPI000A39FA81|nr:S4 domain-containing protein [Thioflexithrix psekupsensis]
MKDATISAEEPIRLDKWLWSARFFKTRSLATEAISGGKVQVNQQRCKPSRAVRVGDQITVRTPAWEKVVWVRGLSRQRGPATVAALLYEETPESIQQREAEAILRKSQAGLFTAPDSRPNKRDRRLIHRFKKDQGWS